MAKVGLDFFPLDVVMDSKMRRIEAEYGLIGFAIVVKLFQRIYRELGYYCAWLPDDVLDFSMEVFGPQNGKKKGSLVAQVVNSAIQRGIFDQKLYTEYGVLTSKKIQEDYDKAVRRRKDVKWIKEYLLVEVAPKKFLPAEDVYMYDISKENADISSKNDDISKQSRVEESRVDNNIFSPPLYEEAEAYRKRKGLQISTQEFLDHYAAQGWRVSNGNPVKAWQPLMHVWARRETEFQPKRGGKKKKPAQPIQTRGSSIDKKALDEYINSQFSGGEDNPYDPD